MRPFSTCILSLYSHDDTVWHSIKKEKRDVPIVDGKNEKQGEKQSDCSDLDLHDRNDKACSNEIVLCCS